MTNGGDMLRKWTALPMTLMLMGGFSMFAPSSASGATKLHTFTFKGNMPDGFGNGLAIETRAKVQFSCNPLTGQFSIGVTDFSVIDENNVAMQWDPTRTPTRVIAV